MKKVLIVLSTILITISFLIIGFSCNIETIIINNIENVLKEEIIEDIINKAVNVPEIQEEEIKKEIKNVIEQNEIVKKTLNECFEKGLDIIMGKEIEAITFTSDLEEIIDSSEEILKNHGITIPTETKNELLKMISNEEFTKQFNETLEEIKENIPSEIQKEINAFNFIRSSKFTGLMIVTIILLLLGIAYLKRSYVKWLTNFSIATIISGSFFGIGIPLIINIINEEIFKSTGNNRILLSTNVLNHYGYLLLTLGVLAIISNIVGSKMLESK